MFSMQTIRGLTTTLFAGKTMFNTDSEMRHILYKYLSVAGIKPFVKVWPDEMQSNHFPLPSQILASSWLNRNETVYFKFNQIAFFVFICFIFMVLCVHVNVCSHVWISLVAPLSDSVTACSIVLSTNHIAPMQFPELPMTKDVCILSTSHMTWLTYILHHMVSTEYTSGTGRTGVNITLILSEHARAAFRPPSCSPQAVWALECIAQELSNSNWCTSSPMKPKPAVYSL